MPKRWILPIAAVMMCTTWLSASEPNEAAVKPLLEQEIPTSLEDKLSAALQSNPQVNLAEAKLLQAEAELKEARLRVTEETIQAHNALEKQQLVIQSRHEQLKRTQMLAEKGLSSSTHESEARIALLEAEGELTQIRARLRHLLGLDGSGTSRQPQGSGGPGVTATLAIQRPPMPDAMQQKLDRVIPEVDLNDSPLPTALEFISQSTGIPIILQRETIGNEIGSVDEFNVNLKLEEVSADALLQAIADQFPPIAFVARDYGLLVTTRFDAESYWAATIPEVPLSPEAIPASERRR